MEIITNLLYGTVDSIKGIKTLFYLDQEMKARNASRILLEQQQQQKGESPNKRQRSGSATPLNNCDKEKSSDENSVSKRVLQCCALNGGIFFLSIAFKNYILMHGIRHIIDKIYGDLERSASMWRYIEPTLDGVFGLLWIMPLFLLSRTVNSLWFQDIADSAFKIRKGRPQLFPSISKFIADVLMSLLVQCLFLGQIWLVKFVPHPYLARAISFVHLALLYSLYSFEYKWFNMGWELHKRLTYIEYNWPYFLGFGIPLAILTELPSDFFVSGCVFSTLFPLFIISGNEASPKAITYDFPIKIFSPVILISNLIIKFNYYKIFNLWCKTSTTPAHRSNSSSSSSYSYTTNPNATPSSITPSSSSRSTPVPTMAQIQRRTRNLR